MNIQLLAMILGLSLSTLAHAVTDSDFEALRKTVAVQQAQIQELKTQNSTYFASHPVIFVANDSCPPGWTEKIELRGRYVVGASKSGVGRVVGSPLVDSENRPTGRHNHQVNDPGHRHDVFVAQSRTGFDSGVIGDMPTANNLSGNTRPIIDYWNRAAFSNISIQVAGNVDGTNAPYIQLLACSR